MAFRIRLLLPLAALLACSSTAPSESVIEQIEVLDHPVECLGQFIQGCLVVRLPDDTGTTRLYDGIRGFAFEWGYRYQLEVERHDIKDGPTDSPSVRRVLRKVISRSRVAAGTSFDMVMTGDGPVQSVGVNQYQWFNSPRFDCEAGSDCASLATALAAGKRVKFTFAYPATAAEPLTVLGWVICNSNEPGASCET